MSDRRARVVDVIFLVVGVFALLVGPRDVRGDGAERFQALERFMTTGALSSPRYSTVVPLLASPLYLVGRAVGDAPAGVAWFNDVLFLVALLLIARELRSDLVPSARRTVVLLLVYASMFPNHVRSFYGEPLTAVAVTLGVLWLSRGKALAGWTAIVLGAVNTPAAILGVGGVAAVEARRKRSWWLFVWPLVALMLGRLEALIVRGSVFATGYEGDVGVSTVMPYSARPGFSYPLFFGLLAIVLSFGKGLVFFAPGLFAPLAPESSTRLRFVHRALLAFVAGLVLVYAKWWAWHSGWFWGPRFFLIASVPACLALGTQLASEAKRTAWQQALLVGAVALSFWVGVNGLVFDQAGLGVCRANDFALEGLCHFAPEFSVLWHPFVDFASSAPGPMRWLAPAACVWWALALAWVLRRCRLWLSIQTSPVWSTVTAWFSAR